MTVRVERFDYSESFSGGGEAEKLPLLPITLTRVHTITADALIDTGSTVNVMPYSFGVQLGAEWSGQSVELSLHGVLAGHEGRGLLVRAQVGRLKPVMLAFAWLKADDMRILLGPTNFFREFDVCLHRSRNQFEVRRSTKRRLNPSASGE